MLDFDNPISKVLRLDEVGGNEKNVKLTATEQELKLIAEQFELVAIKNFSTLFKIRLWQSGGLTITGEISSLIVQECVVTLEPVKTKIQQEFFVRLIPESDVHKFQELIGKDGTLDIDIEGKDPPDIFNGTEVDLGDIALEQFALVIDPFPRLDGVDFQKIQSKFMEPNPSEPNQPSAFAELSSLLSNKK